MTGEQAVRILVADDNDVNQRVIRGMLEHAGYEVDAVHNGGEVLRALESKPYDLVIMDCMMPVMDGYEATRAIRSSGSGDFDPAIPVLAITALAAPGDRQKCLDAGMDDYISKPVVAGPLFHKVEQLIGSRPQASESASASQVPMANILASLSGRLLEDATGWKRELQQLRRDNETQEIGRLAHKVRGSADVFGAKHLSEAAAAVESAVRSGDGDVVPALSDALERELGRLENQLRDPS